MHFCSWGGIFQQTESIAVMTQWLLPANGRENIVGPRLGFGDRPRRPGCAPAVARKESSAGLGMLGQDRRPAKQAHSSLPLSLPPLALPVLENKDKESLQSELL